jgi:hypothetical protein
MVEKEARKEAEKIAWGEKMNKSAEAKANFVQMTEIGLAIDTYDDIFSDFDPRPYSQRALSDDFLLEAKKASKEKVSGMVELKFLVPSEKRKADQENIIKKRLHEHFKKHHDILHNEIRQIIGRGIYFVIAGIILMFIATLIMFKYPDKSILTNFLIILLEPGGWFFFWEGLGQIVFEAKKKRPDLEFYEKMATSEISFLSY